jgi:DNA-binding NarL/FixJ family response regulator
MTYKEIADTMSVAPKTVDGYRETVFQKLHVKSRIGLVILAITKGWIEI